jgi:AI-2 transport protein TqsA
MQPLLLAASFVVVVAGLKAAAGFMVPFMLSFFLAILSLPAFAFLQRRGLPRWLALLLTMAGDIAILLAAVALVGGSLQEFTEALPKYQSRLDQMVASSVQSLDARGIDASEWVSNELIAPGKVMEMVGATLRGVAGVISQTFLVLLIMGFVLAEAAGFPAKLKTAFGHEGDTRFDKMTREVQRYLGFKTLICLATGLLAGVWVGVLGLDFALLWGVTAFVFNYIPSLGSILAAIPPMLLALLQEGPGLAVVVGLGYLVINILFGNLLEPTLMGRKMGLSPLVVFLSLVFWGWIWGPVGMLLSVPLTMIARISFESSEEFRWIGVLLGRSPPPDFNDPKEA